MAVSYNKGDTFRINGNLVVPVGTMKREISVRKPAVDLVIGQADVKVVPEQAASPYNSALDSTVVAAPVAETVVAPVETSSEVSDAPKFENPMASNETTTASPTVVDEPVIPVFGNQVVESPKAEEPAVPDNVIQFPATAIDPASLLSKEEPVEATEEDKKALETLQKAREASMLTTQIIEQQIAILEQTDQHKMVA